MDSAEFLQSAHRLLSTFAATNPKGLERMLFFAEGEIFRTAFQVDDHDAATTGLAVALMERGDVTHILRSFLAEQPPPVFGESYDWLIGGFLFDRGVALETRPFLLEWREPDRLGWFQWVGEGETAGHGPMIELVNAALDDARKRAREGGD